MLEMERDDRDDGSKWDKNTIFSDHVPDNFIRSCSLILGRLMYSFSLNRRRNVSESLESGSDLSNVIRYVPLEAVTKVLFAWPVLKFNDVKEAMLPGMHKLVLLSCYKSYLSSLVKNPREIDDEFDAYDEQDDSDEDSIPCGISNKNPKPRTTLSASIQSLRQR